MVEMKERNSAQVDERVVNGIMKAINMKQQ